MTTDNKIRDQKLRYDINREAEKLSASPFVKLISMSTLQVKKLYFSIKVD